jgi:uncharacterized protein GlcG (DUF336 family)
MASSELVSVDIERIVRQAVAAAEKEQSLLRANAQGQPVSTKMHIAVVDRNGRVLRLHSMADAWVGSINIAVSKARTVAFFSSNENALTSRSIGALTQPGGPLWNIGNSNQEGGVGLIEFPGGIPLYKDGVLVGGVGVSGDGVDQDEHVAAAAAHGFEPAEAIRADTVTAGAVPYTR